MKAINQDSFRGNLKLLFSFKRIVKSSKLGSWPFSKMWSKAADFLGFFTRFPGVILRCSEALTKKCLSDSPEWVALQQLHIHLCTTRELISLCMISLEQNRLESLVFDWKAILNEQYGKWFLMQLCSRFLIKNDRAPKNGKTMSSCFFIGSIWNSLSYIKFLKKLLYASINRMNRIFIKFKNLF